MDNYGDVCPFEEDGGNHHTLFDYVLMKIISYMPEDGDSIEKILSMLGFHKDVHCFFEESLRKLIACGEISVVDVCFIERESFLRILTPGDLSLTEDGVSGLSLIETV